MDKKVLLDRKKELKAEIDSLKTKKKQIEDRTVLIKLELAVIDEQIQKKHYEMRSL